MILCLEQGGGGGGGGKYCFPVFRVQYTGIIFVSL